MNNALLPKSAFPRVVIILSTLNLELNQLIDSVNILSSLNENHQNEIEDLQLRIQQSGLAMEMVMATIHSDNQMRLNAANLLNDITTPQQSPEVNQQKINECYIIYETGGIEALSEKHTEILAIARQCPFQGGDAVYQARALVELFNDSIEYDDAAVCVLEGIYRIGKDGTLISQFIIQPNPANNNIIISMIESEENIQSYEIRDILGKLVIAKEFNNYNRSEHINTSELAVGLYLIYVTSSFGKSSTQKFVIQH